MRYHLFLRFDDYIVRPVDENERNYLTALIEADPHHRDCMDANFFLRLVPGESAWAIENEQGNVLLYFKTQNVARISLQFASEDREENRRVLTRGMAWLEQMLAQNNFHEVLFDTKGRELRLMAKRRLGFRDSPEELLKAIPPAMQTVGTDEVWHHVPQTSQLEG